MPASSKGHDITSPRRMLPEAQKLAERRTPAHEIGERVFVENRHKGGCGFRKHARQGAGGRDTTAVAIYQIRQPFSMPKQGAEIDLVRRPREAYAAIATAHGLQELSVRKVLNNLHHMVLRDRERVRYLPDRAKPRWP